jgi:hypothetical protein
VEFRRKAVPPPKEAKKVPSVKCIWKHNKAKKGEIWSSPISNTCYGVNKISQHHMKQILDVSNRFGRCIACPQRYIVPWMQKPKQDSGSCYSDQCGAVGFC